MLSLGNPQPTQVRKHEGRESERERDHTEGMHHSARSIVHGAGALAQKGGAQRLDERWR
jgi:hypothetical protein